MALPTYAQAAAEWSRLNISPTFGMLFFDHSPIFRALGPAITVPAGRLKVNYTDGATAASLGTTAGIPSTGAPAFVDDTETKVFGAIASQASIDLPTRTQGGGFEAGLSAERAVDALYREWVGQLISLQDGETYGQMWGAGDFVANVTQEADNMTVSGSYDKADFTNTLLKRSVGKMLSKLPQDGSSNVCITSEEGYEAIYTALEGLGGTTPLMTPNDVFGFTNLTYRNTVFFASDKVDNGRVGADAFSDFWFFNNGIQGMKVCVSDAVPAILVDGPKKTAGQLNEVWDIVLSTQVLYTGHHSAGKLTEWVST